MPDGRLKRTRDAYADIQRLPQASRVDVEERAAIMEYDGGLTKGDAEAAALDVYRAQQWRAAVPRT